MQSKLIAQSPFGRNYALVFDLGDDALAQLQDFLAAERVKAARFYGLGGFSRTTLAYYDMEAKRYLPIEIDEQVEVLSFIGNVAMYQEKPRIHAHCVVGHRDGHTTGGHLLAGTVRPTLELMLDEIEVGLQRTDRPEIGIPLLAL
jgi:predicted DNA-binding protein with PD1-like motif